MDQAEEDRRDLRRLAIAHYVVAGLTVLLGGALLAFGLQVVSHMPARRFWPFDSPWNILVVVSALLSFLLALFQALAGRSIAARRRRRYCIVVAAVSFADGPLGMILGVLALVVLLRPSVKVLFDEGTRPAQAPAR